MFDKFKSTALATALCLTAALSNAAGITDPAPSKSKTNGAIESPITSTANDEVLSRSVKHAIDESMGSDGREISVTVNQGIATLNGWTNLPAHTAQARMVAFQVPGIVQSYSQVRTWASHNR